jgi:hypothetical protein
VLALEEGKLGVAEPEPLERVQKPAGAGDDAVAAAVRQLPGEHPEDGMPLPRSAAQCGPHHRQLVMVGQQRRTWLIGGHGGSLRSGAARAVRQAVLADNGHHRLPGLLFSKYH